MNDDEVRELLALAAIGALDDEEAAEVERHIATRPALRAELEGLRGAAAAMAEAVREEPPAGLRARVLDQIASTPQVDAVDSLVVESDPVVAAPPPGAATRAEPPLAPVVPIGTARRRRFATIVGAVAAAAVLVAAALVAIGPLGGDDEPQLADVLAAEDATTTPMTGEVELSLVHSDEHDASVLVGDDVPAPEGEQVYELWLIAEAPPQRVEIFRPDDSGDVAVLIPGMAPGDGTFAVTIEPPGGLDAPTGAIVAATA